MVLWSSITYVHGTVVLRFSITKTFSEQFGFKRLEKMFLYYDILTSLLASFLLFYDMHFLFINYIT